MESALAAKLSAYKPQPKVVELIKNTPILLLVGPTGAGKDALKERLLETGKYHHIISHTTRPPRINRGIVEVDGQDYHFIDLATAERMLDEHELIEAKMYSGNLYGTSVSEIQAAFDEKKIAMTDIEVQGVAEYKALDPGVLAVFLLPPDFGTWQKRLENRYGDVVDVADSRQRLQTALDEINQLLNTDFYTAIINDDLEHTFQQIEAAVTREDYDDSAAREIAKQLAVDIKQHLETA
jgi:guanylate kinase